MKTIEMQAMNTIRKVIEETQARLDAEAAAARVKSIADCRQACLEGVDEKSAAYEVAALVSQTLTVGREDGYPAVNVPDSTKEIVRAACQAGIISKSNGYLNIGKMQWYDDMSGVPGALFQDYDVWSKAEKYRGANKGFFVP